MWGVSPILPRLLLARLLAYRNSAGIATVAAVGEGS